MLYMIFWLIVSFYTDLQAQEIIEPHYSVRAMGMGNAYGPIVVDGDALWYNPANLCRIEGYNWTFMDMRAALNGAEAATQIQSVAGADSLDDYSNLFGTNLNVAAGGKTAIFVPCWSFSAFGYGHAGLSMENPVFPVMDLSYQSDYGVKLGFGTDVAPGVSLGVAFARIIRQGGAVPFGPGFLVSPDSSQVAQQFENRGTGYGMDLGFTWAIEAPISPIISFVWKNVGYVGFSHDGGAGAPPVQRDEMSAGVAFDFDTTLLRIVPVFEIKHINRNDIQFGKKVHLGMEIDLPLLSARAGFHQGYWTAGGTIDLWVMRLDAATWGVEKGIYPGQDEDRRYAAQLTLELGFDADFSFSGFNSGANRRRLKLRR